MSKLSLMIFTLVILTTILCNYSVCSRKRQSPPKFPCTCKVYSDNVKRMEKRSPPRDGVVCVCKKHRPCECSGTEESVDLYNDSIESMRKRFPKGNLLCVCKKKSKGVKGSRGPLNVSTPL